MPLLSLCLKAKIEGEFVLSHDSPFQARITE